MTLDGVNQTPQIPGSRPLGPVAPALQVVGRSPTAPMTADERAAARKKGNKTGLTGPFPNPDLAKLDWSKVNQAAPNGAFSYKSEPLPDMDGALVGKISGQETNEKIVGTYTRFDQAFSSYLGNPPVANWTTFGKFAAREAGQDIARVETELSAFHGNNVHAMFAATRDLVHRPEIIGRFGMPVLADAAKRSGLEWGDVTAAFAGPLGMATKIPKLIHFVGCVKDNMGALLSGLLHAHVGIYDNFGGAFDTFLKTESEGGDGVAAVKTAVQAGKIADPNGLLVDAMGLYKQGRELQQLAGAVQDPTQKQALLKNREELVKRANLLIGFQEQYGVAQPEAFDQPRFRELVGQLSPKLSMRDATGEHELQKHGNWADFTTRMGLVEVAGATAGPAWKSNADCSNHLFRVQDNKGAFHFYKPNPDASQREGTIIEYFDHASVGKAAAANIAAAPPPLEVLRTAPTAELRVNAKKLT
ncbi:MAG: hypothetical protein JWM80_4375 [Cyanobacteria bacterium RYN_339]|nr:hypothetical protein [Cyanobacteria bacterium RYN_339]